MKDHSFWVYILFDKRAGGTYIGVTNNLARRVFEHKKGLVPGFAHNKGINKLGYFEYYKYVDNAIAREKNLKNWHRAWKYRLIETMNPNWEDLAAYLDDIDPNHDPCKEDLIDPSTGKKCLNNSKLQNYSRYCHCGFSPQQG
ncbi:MAG: GIY-YIG nuclease family protein [Alphaproteobacteria bacterium]|nr:GIY-YIG nuclease family protein [Alphaproteobacteria bacterium]